MLTIGVVVVAIIGTALYYMARTLDRIEDLLRDRLPEEDDHLQDEAL